jgi:DNA polymerase-3 subunit alpha
MYSLLDGMSKPEDMIKKVKRMGQTTIAVTEHGNVFSAVKMYKLAKNEGIKFIYGFEAYICEDRFDKSKDSGNRKYYHLTILAKNEQGRLNINKLVSIGYLEGFYYKPRIDKKVLEQYKDGLVILSGCMASELQRLLAEDSMDKAKEIVRWYRNTFGDDYYLEVQSHSEETQQNLNRQIADIAKEYNIPLVTTADSHYVEEEDKELHSIFIEIGQNRDAGETYNDTQLQSEEEARRLLHPALTEEEIDEAITNTLVIADKCNIKIPLSAPLIPHVNVPTQHKNEEEYLKHLCRDGWKYRGFHKLPPQKQKEYLDRFNYEYNAICEMGFAGYYLLVHSYANTVDRRGVARGSGGGSLVAYLMNIVDLDPIEHGLYFERFIDVGALDLLKSGIIKPEELKIPDCA